MNLPPVDDYNNVCAPVKRHGHATRYEAKKEVKNDFLSCFCVFLICSKLSSVNTFVLFEYLPL